MAYVCFNCSKGNWAGRKSQHHKGVAGGSWKHKAQKSNKLFKANLHGLRLMVNDNIERVKLCTDCISKLRSTKELRVGKYHIKHIFVDSPKLTA